ncbi:MAG: OadG family protein [Clostridia bacterium]|nr:OadG family protein [Clostridia bacterium]
MPLFILDPAGPMPISQALLVAMAGILTVLAELGVITLMILLLSKIIRAVAAKLSPPQPEPVSDPIPAPQAEPLPAGESQGTLTLEGVDEPTAAVIMAIVSHQSGIPLNRLRFLSIKEVEDPSA